MQLDDRNGKLRSVESLINRCPGFDSSLGLPGVYRFSCLPVQ